MSQTRWASIIESQLKLYKSVGDLAIPLLHSQLPAISEVLVNVLKSGRKLLLCGNGGSAADCQHIAAELTGRYRTSGRKALPAIALTTDTSALTAIGNDFGFDVIFARQVEALAEPGDVLIAVSTSGTSRNVIEACLAARRKGVVVVALLGGSGGEMLALADHAIVAPSADTPRIQEIHALIGHLLCECIDAEFGPAHG